MDIDISKPNAGRIYDYLLGGSHNFKADRVEAERLLGLMPSMKNGALLNRWFMIDAVQRLARGGFDYYLDLASGLPTEGHIHEQVPEAYVLYNDIDPITVAYGREIVGPNPRVRYIQEDLRNIDAVLRAAEEHFGAVRRVAICFIGAAYFVDDDNLRHVIERLYDWCAPGSEMAMSWMVANQAELEESEFGAIARKMKAAAYVRELEDIRALLSRWQINDPGLIPLSVWNNVPNWRPAGAVDEVLFEQYGVIVGKPYSREQGSGARDQ